MMQLPVLKPTTASPVIDHTPLYHAPFMMVPFGAGQDFIHAAVRRFFTFLELPDPVKTHIDFKMFPKHRRGEMGFRHREPDQDIYNDSKDFFHYHPAIWERYPEFIAQHSTIKDFLSHAHMLWVRVYETMHGVLGSFDQKYGGVLDKIFATDHPHIVLRFLKYHFTDAGRYLAKPHFDSGSFTLALAESTPGLRIGTGPEDLTLVSHQNQEAIFMVSSNIQKIVDTNQLSPGWHDVIQLDETQIGQSFARWAVVAFADGHDVEALPRSETHKFYTRTNQE